MGKRILVFKHMECQNPGYFRQLSPLYDIDFHEVDLHANDDIPEPTDFDGLWVMGGSMDVWEEQKYPWISTEKQAIKRAIDVELPFLGICFGHQLLAEVTGSTISSSKESEVGICTVQKTEDGHKHPLLNNLHSQTNWIGIHFSEISQLSKDTKVLAHNNACSHQIIAVGERAFGCQFHPEVNQTTLEGWLAIPGVLNAMINNIGTAKFDNFKYHLASNLPLYNQQSSILFKNWVEIGFSNK